MYVWFIWFSHMDRLGGLRSFFAAFLSLRPIVGLLIPLVANQRLSFLGL
jgi:hypothetical protein